MRLDVVHRDPDWPSSNTLNIDAGLIDPTYCVVQDLHKNVHTYECTLGANHRASWIRHGPARTARK